MMTAVSRVETINLERQQSKFEKASEIKKVNISRSKRMPRIMGMRMKTILKLTDVNR